MLHVDIPTQAEIRTLAGARSEMCVSLYLPTSELTQETDRDRLELKNLATDAVRQLEAAGGDKRRIESLAEQLDDLVDDDAYWRLQARSLAVFATPEQLRTFRLPNHLTSLVEVADRFHLKPLIRSVTFPHEAIVLALSQNQVRVLDVFAELPPREIKVRDMPKDAASAVGKSTLNDRSPSGRIQGSEGQKVRLRQFARAVDHALRGLLGGRETPLILASTGPVDQIFRSVNTYPHLVAPQIETSPDHLSDLELAEQARPLLDQIHKARLDEVMELFETRQGQGRATTDFAQAARAATYGAIDTLLVDIDEVIPGWVDENDGSVRFADAQDATSYGIVDEIATRALAHGAKVMGVRKSDLPGGAHLAAILRYPI